MNREFAVRNLGLSRQASLGIVKQICCRLSMKVKRATSTVYQWYAHWDRSLSTLRDDLYLRIPGEIGNYRKLQEEKHSSIWSWHWLWVTRYLFFRQVEHPIRFEIVVIRLSLVCEEGKDGKDRKVKSGGKGKKGRKEFVATERSQLNQDPHDRVVGVTRITHQYAIPSKYPYIRHFLRPIMTLPHSRNYVAPPPDHSQDDAPLRNQW